MNLLPSLVNFNIHRQFLPLPHSPEVSKHFVILTTDKNAAQSQRRLRRRQATTHAQHLPPCSILHPAPSPRHPTPTTCLGLPWAALDRLGPLSAFKSKSRNVESLKSVAPPLHLSQRCTKCSAECNAARAFHTLCVRSGHISFLVALPPATWQSVNCQRAKLNWAQLQREATCSIYTKYTILALGVEAK